MKPFEKGYGAAPFRNPVAKFNVRLNSGGPFKDRKKAEKSGYSKHKAIFA
jgi:hypothetical protein